MKLELIRQKANSFPDIEHPLSYTDVRIWHCNYASLSRLSDFRNVQCLEIATLPDSSLDFVGKLSALKSLQIVHLPKIHDIAPLSKLRALETLELATLPSWDASSKRQHISSLKPLQHLAKLQSLALYGIVVDDGLLQPLYSCQSFKELRCSNLFSAKELARLKAMKPELIGTLLEPVIEVQHSYCSSCGTQKIMLSGVSRRSIMCPKCNAKRVQKHVEEWHTY
jgi:hypothetical protein